jgi:DNA excision repair protein ERCC-2
VTGLRGTLTEGVDYDGDKLAGCLVVGVPVANIGTPRQQAMIAAYRERYGHQRGFEYAMTVPAVRKARQALGRVIRGDEDVGVRLLLDERYCQDGSDASGTDGGVRQYLSPAEQREYITYESVDAARRAVASFWP